MATIVVLRQSEEFRINFKSKGFFRKTYQYSGISKGIKYMATSVFWPLLWFLPLRGSTVKENL